MKLFLILTIVQVWVKSEIKKSINVLKMQFLHFISTKKLECP